MSVMSFKLLHASLLVLLNLLTVDLLTQDVYWRDYIPGDLPYDAIEAAPGRYIGQVYHKGFIVGTIYPHTGTAVIIYNDRQDIDENVKILCSHKQDRLYWDEVDFTEVDGKQMNDAVKGGFQEKWNADLFVGKDHHEGEWRIGKVLATGDSNEGLWIWDADGYEVILKKFYLLKYNSTVDDGNKNWRALIDVRSREPELNG